MSLIDSILKTHGSFFLLNDKIYTVNPRGMDGRYKGRGLQELGEVAERYHLWNKTFTNASKFYQELINPMLGSSSKVHLEQTLNYIGSGISRTKPTGIGGTNVHTFMINQNGELELEGRKYAKKKLSSRIRIRPRKSLETSSTVGIKTIKGQKFLWKKLKPYSMKNLQGETFLFDGTEILMRFEPRQDRIKIGTPKLPENYKHPFAYVTGDICYNGEERWEDMGIEFGARKINYELAKDISKIIFEAQGTITEGYNGGVFPIHQLDRQTFPREYYRGQR